ncbi:MAG TPA: NADH-quinone oxidoreductase subunit C [Herpetosiphonaceae bacterium]|jgi:NADH-quinone oxidoreductase subunit C|nr:NADH-quinone oxidoreductase subunit C [Herpetosiphonaceae bacterium]
MLRSGELRELLARDLPGALAPGPARYGGGNGGSVREGAAASAKGVHGEGTRPRLQDYDAVVNADSLPRVAAYLRDRHGYAFLSNITAVDYILDGLIEVVYHFFNLAGGGPQTVRVRLSRERPIVPSLTGEWPGANLQEREAFDLYGVQFPGHPYLRRIYMWDEFVGHPMRKDFPKTGDKYTHETGGE